MSAACGLSTALPQPLRVAIETRRAGGDAQLAIRVILRLILRRLSEFGSASNTGGSELFAISR
jgi:hypothetical protein